MVLGRRVVILDQLRLRGSLAQLLGLPAGRRREEPHLALELDQLLIGVRLHFQALELLYEGIAREVLVHLGRRDQLALLVLDLLGHALERLEHALVADRGHGFLDALVRLGALLPRDQDVLLALRLLDPIVQLAERQLELLGFLAMLHPRLVQLHRALRVLVVTQQGLLREVVPPLLHRQHGPALPILGALLLGVHLRRQALLVRDGRRHLLFGLRQLTAHVDDQLVQHLFRILGTVDQVVDVRPDQRRETVKDSHETPRCPGGASLSRAHLTLPPLGEHALGEIYALGELGDLCLEVRHLSFQRRHPLGILALGAPAPLGPRPDTLGDRLAHRCPENPTQGHGHPPDSDHRRDDGHDLVEDEVRVQPRRRQAGLDHVDAVRLSPGPSFPSPSRVFASSRSVKSTRSASSATSRRSSSTATSTSSCPIALGAWVCALSFAVYVRLRVRAIIHAKKPPTAMIGIRTPSSPAFIGSSRRRSFARSDPLTLAVLREQPLGEVQALRELRHLAPHGLELLVERILLFRELGAQTAATGRGVLAADPVGQRAADRRERHRDARAAPENEDDGQDVFHTRQCGRASRWPSRSLARRRSVKSSRSSASATRRLSSSSSASSRSVSPPRTTPCLAAFIAIHCSSVFDHPRIHSASALPTGPAKTSVAPITRARPITPTAGAHSPMRQFPP